MDTGLGLRGLPEYLLSSGLPLLFFLTRRYCNTGSIPGVDRQAPIPSPCLQDGGAEEDAVCSLPTGPWTTLACILLICGEILFVLVVFKTLAFLSLGVAFVCAVLDFGIRIRIPLCKNREGFLSLPVPWEEFK